MTTFIEKLRKGWRNFSTANCGNVAIIFGLSLLPIMGFVGSAVDYSRANSARAAMQAAVDATALMLSKNITTIPTAQIGPTATNYFNALFNRTEVKDIAVTTAYTTAGGTEIVVTGAGKVPTTFMKIMGFSSLDISSSGTVKWGNTRLRVALVLDNTGSMSSDGKMTALITATKSLLTQLQSVAVNPGDVYVSIVPFVKDVNLGAGNYGQSWIDWGDPTVPGKGWEAPPALVSGDIRSSINTWMQVAPGSNCPFTDSSYGFTCTNRPATTSGASTASKIPSSGSYKGYICPSIDSGNKNALKADIYYNGCYDSSTYTSPTGSSATCGSHLNCSCTGSGASKVCKTKSGFFEHTWRQPVTPAGQVTAAPPHSTWNGCVTDRGDSGAPNVGNYDTNVTAPTIAITATLLPAEQYNSCPQAVMALNTNWSAMTTLVNNMSPAGNTNQAIGLALGWMSLVGGGPFPPPPAMDPSYTYQQVIILLTDGLNTEDRWYTSQTSIDNREQITCNNVNAGNITLYTVQVNTGGDPTSQLLKNCAGTAPSGNIARKYPDPDKFFLLTSASAIVTTFNKIATDISRLYVAK